MKSYNFFIYKIYYINDAFKKLAPLQVVTIK